ncbi:MAG: transpeptidase family protein [Acidobacteria bacterium]|nr:transpeptidase family protein [Acidobacteriota bacterium]
MKIPGPIVAHRLILVYILVTAWSAVLAARLVYLQVVKGSSYRLQAEQQRIGFIELANKRGEILDRHLEELAINVETESIFTHPREITDSASAARILAPLLGQDEQEVLRKLTVDRPFVYLARKVSPGQAQAVRQLRMPGIYFQKESKRVYPNRELAAHLLGFVGIDNEGLSGLEYLYDEKIRGRRERINLRIDALRQSYERDSSKSGNEANVLILNTDKTLQFIAEQVLAETVRGKRAKSGTAIVMNPRNGQILAMASYPSFNPNRHRDYHEEVRRNRAILEIHEPGSTFKIITAAAVLNEGLIDPLEMIDCRVGTLRLGGKIYREAKQSYGFLTFDEIVAKSSNVGTIKLGLRLGDQRLYSYIKRFGFGEKTGIELPGEQAGILRPPSEWSKISIGALSIGQEIGVTPLQVLRAFAVIANGGYLVRPQLVQRILSAQGDVIHEPEVRPLRIVTPQAAYRAKHALSQVVNIGTGRSAQLAGYSSAGKTGTAQKFVNGSYSRTQFVASYAGFAPVDEPALAAIVMIDEPAGEYYGSLVAAPAFKQIMERALHYLKIPQDRPVHMELAASNDVSVAEDELFPKQLEETVRMLMEEKEEKPSNTGHVVTVGTGFFTLPDFSGLSLREVARECARRGVRLKVKGSGIAVGQRPLPGTQIYPNSLCEVFFAPAGKVPGEENAPKQIAFRTGRSGADP